MCTRPRQDEPSEAIQRKDEIRLLRKLGLAHFGLLESDGVPDSYVIALYRISLRLERIEALLGGEGR